MLKTEKVDRAQLANYVLQTKVTATIIGLDSVKSAVADVKRTKYLLVAEASVG